MKIACLKTFVAMQILRQPFRSICRCFGPKNRDGPQLAGQWGMDISIVLFVVFTLLTGGFLVATLKAESILDWPLPKQTGDTSLGVRSVDWLMALATSTALPIGLLLI